MLRTSPNRLWQVKPTEMLLHYPDYSRQERVVMRVDWASGRALEAKRWLEKVEIVGVAAGAGPAARGPEPVILRESFGSPRGFYRLSSRLEVAGKVLTQAEAEAVLADVRIDRFATRVVDELGDFRVAATSVIRPSATKTAARGAVICIYPGSPMSFSVTRYAGGTACTIPVTELLSHGYTVVLADILGPPSSVPLEGELIRARTVLDSLVPQLYLAAERGYIDIGALVVMGHSQGALASVQAASSTTLFRGAIGFSGVRYAPFNQTIAFPTNAPSSLGYVLIDAIHFTAGLSDILDNAPYYRAARVTAPILLVHGEVDMAPIAASELMADALQRAGKQVELVRYPGEGHDVERWSDTDRADVTRRVLTFLEKCFARRAAK
ncbi:MAG: prolyl oligopeptidase family serine peptidase [Gammaproteobacteria bacterium]